MRKILLVIFLFFSVSALSQAESYNDLEKIETSVIELERKISVNSPFNTPLEWKSFHLLMTLSTQQIQDTLDANLSEKEWNITGWRKAVVELGLIARKAEAILLKQHEQKKSLWETIMKPDDTDLAITLTATQKGLESDYNEATEKLTQIRLLAQGFDILDEQLSAYQRRLLNNQLLGTDKQHFLALSTYQNISESWLKYQDGVKQALPFGSKGLFFIPSLIMFFVLLIFVFYRQLSAQQNTKNTRDGYDYKETLGVAVSYGFSCLFSFFISLALLAIYFVVIFFFSAGDVGNLDQEAEFTFPTDENSYAWIIYMVASVYVVFLLLCASKFILILTTSGCYLFDKPDFLRNISHRAANIILLIVTVFIAYNLLEYTLINHPATDQVIVYLAKVIYTLSMSILIFMASRGKLWLNNDDSQNSPGRVILKVTLLIIRLSAAVSFLLVLFQRTNLAVYLVNGIVISFAVFCLFFLIKSFLSGFFFAASRKNHLISSLEVSSTTLSIVVKGAYFAAITYIGFSAVFYLATIWGISAVDINNTLYKLWNGFAVGNVTISLSGILSSIVVFVVLIIANSFIKRFLGSLLEHKETLSESLRLSIITSIGYLGIIIAITVSVAVLGVNLTNIALIASGLSLGIGFGLQNIVSNFFSGIILLIERPFSIGDWIVVNGNEGIVSGIRFRATEVTTFDKASVLVPNSDLISNVVANMTHEKKIRRIAIPVRVAYSSDAEQVESVLLGCLEGVEGIINNPEPQVLFMDLSEYSMQFELRCFTNDALNSLGLSSKLRFKIKKAFETHDLVMPCPQSIDRRREHVI